MKISFNTRKVTRSEIDTLLNIIYGLMDELGMNVDEPLGDMTDKAAESEVKTTTVKSIEPIEGMPNTFTIDFEPDDEDGDPSDADRLYFLSPTTVENLTLTNTGDHKITVIEPGESATVSVPVVPPPPVTSLHTMMVADASSPPMEVVVPPAPTTVTPPTSTSQPESVPQGSSPYVDPYDSQSGDLDSDGTPWDATIHSESRAKNADGTWRKRRVNKNVEVKAAVPGLEAITPNSVPAPPTIRATPPARGLTVEPSVPPPPPAAPPVIKTAAPGAPAGTWPELMERVTKYFGAQKITSVDLAEICKTFNIGSVQECFTQPHLIPLVSSAIDAKAGVCDG